MHLSSISSLIVKGLNTFVNKVFDFFLLKKRFALSLWGIVGRLMRIYFFMYLIHFRIMLMWKEEGA